MVRFTPMSAFAPPNPSLCNPVFSSTGVAHSPMSVANARSVSTVAAVTASQDNATNAHEQAPAPPASWSAMIRRAVEDVLLRRYQNTTSAAPVDARCVPLTPATASAATAAATSGITFTMTEVLLIVLIVLALVVFIQWTVRNNNNCRCAALAAK
jgi:hypothetical protein